MIDKISAEVEISEISVLNPATQIINCAYNNSSGVLEGILSGGNNK